MASINMISEGQATDRVKEIYDEIKAQLGIDFVPNLSKVMAAKPGHLEANWRKVETVMAEPGKLDRMTKEIITREQFEEMKHTLGVSDSSPAIEHAHD